MRLALIRAGVRGADVIRAILKTKYYDFEKLYFFSKFGILHPYCIHVPFPNFVMSTIKWYLSFLSRLIGYIGGLAISQNIYPSCLREGLCSLQILHFAPVLVQVPKPNNSSCDTCPTAFLFIIPKVFMSAAGKVVESRSYTTKKKDQWSGGQLTHGKGPLITDYAQMD